MTDPETEACTRLTDLLDQTLQDLRAGHAIGSGAWDACYPEEAAHLRALLQTAQTLDAAAADWRGAALAAAATGPAAADPTEPWPAQVGRYQVLGRVGSGGMGAVYRARDPGLDRVVAVKVPRFQGPAEARELARQRFLREARAAARVRHPNICPLYDVGEYEGTPYAVMAFIEGPSLAEALRQGPMEPARAVRLARQVARALEAVHAEGVIHRDLKPANVLLDRAGEPLLTDFGLARSLALAEPLTEPGTVMGTPAYMAPEQAAGDLGRVGPWTDVYGLGVVLSQMLAGRGSAERPAPRTANPAGHETLLFPDPADLDPALAEVLDRATARRPEDRYQSAREMADALDRWLAGRAPATAVQGLPRAVAAGTPAQTAVQSVLPDGSAVTITVNHPAAAKDVTVTVSEREFTQRRRRKVIRITVAFGVLLLALLPLTAWWLAGSSPQAFRGGSWLPWQRARDERRAAEQAAARVEAERRQAEAGKQAEVALRARVEAAVAQAEGLKRAGNLAQAIAAYEKAEPLAAQVYGSESPQTAALAAYAAALYQAQGRYTKAERLYRRSLKIRVARLGPDHPEVLQTRTRLATLYHARGEYPRAEAEYRQVRECQERLLREHPEVPEYQSRLAQTESNLGELYRAAGQWDQALTSYRRAIALKPDDPEAHTNLGVVLTHLRDLDGAIAAHRRAIQLDPRNAKAYANLGQALRARGDLDGAVAAHRRAIALDPRNAKAHANLGLVLQDQGRLDEAIAEYREAVRLKPDYPEAHNNLGVAFHQQGRLDEAVAALREAVRLKKDYPSAYARLGKALEQTGRLREAEAAYRQAVSLQQKAAAESPDRPEHRLELAASCNNLGAVLQASGRPEQAEQAYRQALALQEQLSAANRSQARNRLELAATCNGLGKLLQARGKYAEAEPLFRRALALREKALGPDHPELVEVLEGYAAVLRQIDRPEEAARLQQRAKAIRDRPAPPAPRK
jgi:serine/threonine-protein kinase